MVKDFKVALDESLFTLSDFTIGFPDSGKVLATATFIADPQYTFQLGKEDEETYTLETPGEHYWSERNRVYGIPAGIQRIGTWCKNIKADIRAKSPIFDEFEELRQDLKAKIAEHEEDLEGHFTREEAAAMEAKFDQLIKRFEELRKKNEITEKELTEIKRDLTALKEDARTFEKAAFFKTAGNKILNVCRRIGGSKAARAIGLEAAKEVTKLALEGKLQLPGQ